MAERTGQDRLIVALDVDSVERGAALVDQLRARPDVQAGVAPADGGAADARAGGAVAVDHGDGDARSLWI